MGRHLVEGVGEDVEPRGRRPLVRALERIDLLQLPVRLDDDEVRGSEPERFRQAGSATEAGEDGGEEPDRHRPPPVLPAVEDRQKPVGVRGRRTVRSRRRRVPGGVRQQEVDHGRFEFREGVEDGLGVVAHVHGAEQPEVEVAVPVLPEELDGLEHQGWLVRPSAYRRCRSFAVRSPSSEMPTLTWNSSKRSRYRGLSWTPLVWIRRSSAAMPFRADPSSSQIVRRRAGPARSGSPRAGSLRQRGDHAWRHARPSVGQSMKRPRQRLSSASCASSGRRVHRCSSDRMRDRTCCGSSERSHGRGPGVLSFRQFSHPAGAAESLREYSERRTESRSPCGPPCGKTEYPIELPGRLGTSRVDLDERRTRLLRSSEGRGCGVDLHGHP